MQEKACGEWRRRMIAAEILRVTDRKRKIVLEDESSFVLYAGELRKYHIREGEEIPEEVLEEIHDDVLVKRAKLRCMNLLKTSDRTVHMWLPTIIQMTNGMQKITFASSREEKAEK